MAALFQHLEGAYDALARLAERGRERFGVEGEPQATAFGVAQELAQELRRFTRELRRQVCSGERGAKAIARIEGRALPEYAEQLEVREQRAQYQRPNVVAVANFVQVERELL